VVGHVMVVRKGTLTTVQDTGRLGQAYLAVPPSGALDLPAAALANRLVGNSEHAAVLETTVDGVGIRFGRAGWAAVTGAWCHVTVAARPAAWAEAIRVPAGGVLQVGAARRGLRSYLAVDGGFAPAPVLGSCSTDQLSGLGPPALVDGMEVPLGAPGTPGVPGPPAVPAPPGDTATLLVWPGPRDDWLAAGHTLIGHRYTVSPISNRIGLRLTGPALARRPGELASEATVTGAIQVPADGVPLIFLADHPTTVGYPIVAVVDPGDLALCAQLRPGTDVTFATVPGRSWRSSG
jgi:biotin-dependent carboxylase-like uncharacterized protein